MLSRFLPTSELSLLNAAGTLAASPELVEVTRLALDARERTGGRFDPTVHDAVVAAGYDRSFDDVAPDGESISPGGPVVAASPSTARRSSSSPGTGSISAASRRDMPPIGRAPFSRRPVPCVANVGGDLAIQGVPAEGVWPVAVETPGRELTLGLASGALATSGRDHRRWRRGGVELHHLVDPSTGLPAVTSLLRVTAFAATAAAAEVAAKVLLLAGERAALVEADALGIPAVLVAGDGRVVLAGGLA